jgi:hypothetical protein
MEKAKLVELVRQEVVRQQPTLDSVEHTHPQAIEDEVERAYDALVKQYYANNKNMLEADFDYYAKKYNSNAVQSVSDDIRYIQLPAKVIDLPMGTGLVHARARGGKINFHRVTEAELDSIRNLEIYCCSGKVFYYKDGDRIVLDSPINEFGLIESVDLKLVVPFSEFLDTDDIHLPTGDMVVSSMILELMGYKPTDNTNDNIA